MARHRQAIRGWPGSATGPEQDGDGKENENTYGDNDMDEEVEDVGDDLWGRLAIPRFLSGGELRRGPYHCHLWVMRMPGVMYPHWTHSWRASWRASKTEGNGVGWFVCDLF